MDLEGRGGRRGEGGLRPSPAGLGARGAGPGGGVTLCRTVTDVLRAVLFPVLETWCWRRPAQGSGAGTDEQGCG